MSTTIGVAPRLLSTVQAAQYLGLSRYTMHRLRVSGEIPAIDRFKHVRFDLRDLDAFIDASKAHV